MITQAWQEIGQPVGWGAVRLSILWLADSEENFFKPKEFVVALSVCVCVCVCVLSLHKGITLHMWVYTF